MGNDFQYVAQIIASLDLDTSLNATALRESIANQFANEFSGVNDYFDFHAFVIISTKETK